MHQKHPKTVCQKHLRITVISIMSLETEIFTEHNSQQGTIHQLDGSTAIGERRYQRHQGQPGTKHGKHWWLNQHVGKYARQNGFIFRFCRVNMINMFELPPPNMANEDVSSVILLMVHKSGDHHLGCIRNPVDNWINDQSTGAGFLPWIVLCDKTMPAAFFLLI